MTASAERFSSIVVLNWTRMRASGELKAVSGTFIAPFGGLVPARSSASLVHSIRLVSPSPGQGRSMSPSGEAQTGLWSLSTTESWNSIVHRELVGMPVAGARTIAGQNDAIVDGTQSAIVTATTTSGRTYSPIYDILDVTDSHSPPTLTVVPLA